MARPETVQIEVAIPDIINAVIASLKEHETLVEVVRCGECKHSRDYKHTKEYVNCEVDSSESIDRDANWFCADGERREDG